MASSSALLNELIKSGTRIGTRAFERLMRLPLSKSAPLAFCAMIILSVSSSKVGINLSAIVIIIASSCAGNPIFEKRLNSFSIPSVNTIGDVVKVSSEVAETKRIILIGKGQILMDGTLEDIKKGGSNIDETIAELYRTYEI